MDRRRGNRCRRCGVETVPGDIACLGAWRVGGAGPGPRAASRPVARGGLRTCGSEDDRIPVGTFVPGAPVEHHRRRCQLSSAGHSAIRQVNADLPRYSNRLASAARSGRRSMESPASIRSSVAALHPRLARCLRTSTTERSDFAAVASWVTRTQSPFSDGRPKRVFNAGSAPPALSTALLRRFDRSPHVVDGSRSATKRRSP